MINGDDIDGLAAEYVLGTLDQSERATVTARRQREPALEAAIIAWERRLAPLADAVVPVEPSPDALAKIESRLRTRDGATDNGASVIQLKKRVNAWRAAAMLSSAVAASLAIFVGVREFQRPSTPGNLVAVLQKDAASPAFLVTVNVENRVMTVRPVAAPAEPGKSYELWIVHDSLGAPKSLGLIDGPGVKVKPQLAAYKPDVIESATFAVSLEPEGGSTTGAPTGPVVFAGKVIPEGK